MRSKLKEKEEICEKLESEVISLRKKFEMSNAQSHRSLKSNETLNKILIPQRPPFIKTGLGYDENQKTPEEHASKEN